MSINDDHCDFCGAYMDPIGGDTATLIDLKLWDGQCQEGLLARWDRFSTPQLEVIKAAFEARIVEDPIDWSGEADKDKPAKERLNHRLDQIIAHEFLSEATRMLTLRYSNEGLSYEDDLPTYTEVAQDLEDLATLDSGPLVPRRRSLVRCQHGRSEGHIVEEAPIDAQEGLSYGWCNPKVPWNPYQIDVD